MVKVREWAVRAAIIAAALMIWSGSVTAQSVRVVEWSRGNSTAALLFVHGLGGCAVPAETTAEQWCFSGTVDSFRNQETGRTWPEIVASDSRVLLDDGGFGNPPGPMRVRDLGVIGVDYSRATANDCPNFSIPQLSQAILAQLEASDVLDKYEQFIIVAHSLGGLVVKQIFQFWNQTNDVRARQVIGLMLLGVPSQGAPLADKTWQYLDRFARLSKKANLCVRQIEDLFPGDRNTYLQNLETSWASILQALRRESGSELPIVGCAYESVPTVQFLGFSADVVPQLYTATQCSLTPLPIGRSHTELSKPAGPDDDVHGPWLVGGIRETFKAWAPLPLSRFEFSSKQPTLEALRDHINAGQRAFKIELDGNVTDFKPGPGPFNGEYRGGNRLALVSSIVRGNPQLCMEVEFPAGASGRVTLRSSAACK
jgi:pimeloyl-ACP methyl ester carboxylesterase